LKNYIVNRFAEASTWRGIVMLFTALGVTLNSAQTAAIVSAGMALAGLIAVFVPDQPNAPKE
jgi:hypothetical protein